MLKIDVNSNHLINTGKMAYGKDTEQLLKILEKYDYKNPIMWYCYERKNLFLGEHLRIWSLPPLPPRLESFSCYIKSIQNLRELPPKLRDLTLRNMKIHSLPELPETLQYLECIDLHLLSLPKLPQGLKILICRNLKITSLPTLPETLEYLDCGDSHILSFPKLPPTLRVLFCDNTSISELPELPDSLEELYCQNIKQLHNLPKLPDRLRVLCCKNTHIDLIKPSETVNEYKKRLNEYFEEKKSQKRIQERTRLYKEALMMEAWKPDRLEKWLEVGYDPDD